MLKIINNWRFYTLGREQYRECMAKTFTSNLIRVRWANLVLAIFASLFSIILFIQGNYSETIVYISVAAIAAFLAFYTNYLMQKADVNFRTIYVLIGLFYINFMAFGIYISVWSPSAHDSIAAIFYVFLICAFLMFINSPVYNFFLILSALIAFIISVIVVKNPANAFIDVTNALITGLISLYFSWLIPKLRMELELSAIMLEEERNKYFDQSTIDELTRMKNRRDYMITFKRYLVNYRTTDDWICVAICDIDFFKFYNDHYGHPKGDDCLRAIGGVLDSLKESLGVYTARVGGEEFSLLWFEKDLSHIDTVANHLSKMIYDLRIPHEKSTVSPYVTLSMGVYVERCGASSDVKPLYNLADKALYSAKGSGRNCTVVTGSEITEYKITSVSAEEAQESQDQKTGEII
ncbi:MAG: diguanylate cyclase [Treponema sp.]|nr:diguanylate cyclase [Treponema sp.]